MAFLDEIISSKTERDYLLISEVRTFGQQYGLESIQEQDEALSLFHERGLLVRLTASETLKSIVITKPQWLVDGLSKLIRDHDLHLNLKEFETAGLLQEAERTFGDGIASRDLLEFLWKGSQVEFLIDLMKRTMLMSEWKSKESYLIPSLLQADIASRHELSFPANVKYDFSEKFLPKGVFQRLVCLFVESSFRKGVLDENTVVLRRNFVSLNVLSGGKVELYEDLAEECILISIESEQDFEKVSLMAESMLKKINYDAMNGGLDWNRSYVGWERQNYIG